MFNLAERAEKQTQGKPFTLQGYPGNPITAEEMKQAFKNSIGWGEHSQGVYAINDILCVKASYEPIELIEDLLQRGAPVVPIYRAFDENGEEILQSFTFMKKLPRSSVGIGQEKRKALLRQLKEENPDVHFFDVEFMKNEQGDIRILDLGNASYNYSKNVMVSQWEFDKIKEQYTLDEDADIDQLCFYFRNPNVCGNSKYHGHEENCTIGEMTVFTVKKDGESQVYHPDLGLLPISLSNPQEIKAFYETVVAWVREDPERRHLKEEDLARKIHDHLWKPVLEDILDESEE